MPWLLRPYQSSSMPANKISKMPFPLSAYAVQTIATDPPSRPVAIRYTLSWIVLQVEFHP